MQSLSCARTVFAAALVFSAIAFNARAADVIVTAARVPDRGLQPQAVVDDKGIVHLIYLKGDPAASDVFYVHSTDGGATWSAPVPVSSQSGSAIALGNVRGPHLALGENGSIHVAWTGSNTAMPKTPGGQHPMLYTRGTVDASGKITFEPQRNVMMGPTGCDGGAVASDGKGHVYVAWHAPARKGGGEDARRVWVAISSDNGATFAPEVAVSDKSTGVCGCCGLDVLAGPDGRLFTLYRAATEQVNRDMYLVSAGAKAADPQSEKVAPSRSNICLMSTSSLVRGPAGIVAAWETTDKVQWGVADVKTGRMSDPVTAAGPGAKHPALAVNHNGETLVAWAQGTGWNKGGSVSWQVYDANGKLKADAKGHVDGLPVWSKPAAFTRSDGTFVVLY